MSYLLNIKKKTRKKRGVAYEILLGGSILHRVLSLLGVYYVNDVGFKYKYIMETSQNRKENRQIRYGLDVGGLNTLITSPVSRTHKLSGLKERIKY